MPGGSWSRGRSSCSRRWPWCSRWSPATPRHAAVDSDQFANRATAALRDDSVRSLIAEKITDEVVLKHAGRPARGASADRVRGLGRSSAAARSPSLFRSAVRDVHRAALRPRREHGHADDRRRRHGPRRGAREAAARRSREQVDSTRARRARTARHRRASARRSRDVARAVRVLALLLLRPRARARRPARCGVSPDRRRTVVELGIGAAAAGVAARRRATASLRSVAVDHVQGPDAAGGRGRGLGRLPRRPAHRGVDPRRLGRGRSPPPRRRSSGRSTFGEPLRRGAPAGSRREPRPPGAAGAARRSRLIAAGLLVLVERDAVLALAAHRCSASTSIYEGVSAILRLVYRAARSRGGGAPAPGAARRAAARSRRRGRAAGASRSSRRVVAVFVGTGGATTAAPADGRLQRPRGAVRPPARPRSRWPPPTTRCRSRCRAGTRPSRSAPIADQLARRHPRPADRHPLRRPAAERQAAHVLRQPAGARAAGRAGRREPGRRRRRAAHPRPARLQRQGQARHVPLPHVLRARRPRRSARCSTTSTTSSSPTPARSLVVDQPGLRDAGGLRRRREGRRARRRSPTAARPTGDWPTLREMIDSNQRVVFLAENHAGGAPWYHLAYKAITEETPYAFTKVAQLTDPASCRRAAGRTAGRSGAPLFLVNHWITTDPVPLPSNH